VESSLVHGTVSEKTGTDASLTPVFRSKGQSHRNGKLTADNGVAAHEGQIRVKEVHGTALALADSGGLAKQFGHDPLRVGAPNNGLGVLAVGGQNVIITMQTGGSSDSHRFLPAVKMEKTGDVPLGILFGTRFLELAAESHLLIKFQQLLIGQNCPEFCIHEYLVLIDKTLHKRIGGKSTLCKWCIQSDHLLPPVQV